MTSRLHTKLQAWDSIGPAPALSLKDITTNYVFGLQWLILASLLPWGCHSPLSMHRGISMHHGCPWLLSSALLSLGLFPGKCRV